MDHWIIVVLGGAYLLRAFCEPVGVFRRRGSISKAVLGASLVLWVVTVVGLVNGG